MIFFFLVHLKQYLLSIIFMCAIRIRNNKIKLTKQLQKIIEYIFLFKVFTDFFPPLPQMI